MFLDDRHADVMSQGNVSFKIAESIAADRRTYDTTVSALQSYLISKGLDKITARKQARGAARGYLGNALASEMLFSAPVSGWRWIISQRASRLADAEIRTIYCQVLNELKRSRYGYYFDDYDLVDSPDGMGQILSNP
jgi:thymidylate synthase ThyX